ncbi:MAG: hypothetical protein K6E29_08240 [Cyanobacteria bacterium RUI128]|nr:hypothetical protein [Cyanobacteria bacterium RUI128]
MKKESSKMLKLITNEKLDVQTDVEQTNEKVYQSTPSAKTDLYAKMLAFRQSQKKFNVQDLIKDNLK